MELVERILGELVGGARHIRTDDLDLLEPEMFEHPPHRKLFEAWLGGERNPAILSKKAGIHFSEVSTWMMEIALPDDFQEFADRYYQGKAVELVNSRRPLSEVADEIQQLLFRSRGSRDQANIIREYETFEKTYREGAGKGLLGLSTGLAPVDEITFGLIPSHVWVVGAYRGWGKSYMGINIGNAVLQQGKPVVFFNLEMSNNEMIQRLIGLRAGAGPLQVLQGGEAVQDAKDEVLQALDGNLLIMNDELFEVNRMDWELQRLTQEQPIGLVVIDYVQLIRGQGTDYEVLRDGVKDLQRLAKKYNTTVLIISQISNEAQKAGLDSNLDGFRGAGEIGQVANVAIRIYRERENDKLTPNFKLHFTKVRHNRDGLIELMIDFPGGVIRPRTTAEISQEIEEKATKQAKTKALIDSI